MPDLKPQSIHGLLPSAPSAGSAFRKYAPALHRYITQRMRHPADAPDLTQEIFERFMQIPQKDAIRDAQAYLYGIAAHLVSEWREREQRRIVTYDSDVMQTAAESLENALPDTMAERFAAEQDLRYALAQLPTMQRAVLLLAKREGLTHEEIAEKTGLLTSTVTNYVCEACAKVKLLLRTQRNHKDRP
jgi:RNA polymerase sigma-70 factor (ECF subfamily)